MICWLVLFRKEVNFMARLSVQFDNNLSKKLGKLAKQRGTTKTEIIRRAIATYNSLDEEVNQNGGKVMIVKDNESIA